MQTRRFFTLFMSATFTFNFLLHSIAYFHPKDHLTFACPVFQAGPLFRDTCYWFSVRLSVFSSSRGRDRDSVSGSGSQCGNCVSVQCRVEPSPKMQIHNQLSVSCFGCLFVSLFVGPHTIIIILLIFFAFICFCFCNFCSQGRSSAGRYLARVPDPRL